LAFKGFDGRPSEDWWFGKYCQSELLESLSLDGMPTLRQGLDFDPYTELPTETRVRIRMNTAYQNSQLADAPNNGNPQFQFNTS
jgi:hypothetical protein